MDESLQTIAEEDGRQARIENDYEAQKNVIENPNHVEEAISKIKV